MSGTRGLGLIHYDAMVEAIAVCRSIDEVKELRDKARALEVYAAQAMNHDAERKCIEVRIRAERRAGELRKEMKETGQRHSGRGNNPKKLESSHTTPTPPQLADMGISKDQSSQWQQLADVPEAEFEAAINRDGRMPTTEGIIHESKPYEPPPTVQIDEDALWLFGRLGDIERRGIFDRNLSDMLALMSPAMREECERLLPILRRWLESEATGERHKAA